MFHYVNANSNHFVPLQKGIIFSTSKHIISLEIILSKKLGRFSRLRIWADTYVRKIRIKLGWGMFNTVSFRYWFPSKSWKEQL